MYSIIDIAFRLATLGHIHKCIELLSLSNAYHTIRPSSIYTRGLYFAFQSVNEWPTFVPEEHRTPAYLAELEQGHFRLWGVYRYYTAYPDGVTRPPLLARDASGLKTLLEWRDSGNGGVFAYTIEGDDKRYVEMYEDGVVLTALDIALSIEGHEEHITRLQDIVKADLDTYLPEVGKSRAMWTILKTGVLEPEGMGNEIEDVFNRSKDILKQRIESGAQRPFKDKTMEELVHIIDENTRRHEYAEREYDQRFQMDQNQLNNVRNDSILHYPASVQDIASLEERLNTTLPEDYKEYLRITDGMNTVWNGVYHESFVASSFNVRYEDQLAPLDIPTPCELLPWEELPYDSFKVDWPELDFKQVIQLHDIEYGDLEGTWLVKPEMVRKAVETFFERFDMENDEEVKKLVERAVVDHFGGMEQLRNMEWGLLREVHQTGYDAYGSFRDFIEHLAANSL